MADNSAAALSFLEGAPVGKLGIWIGIAAVVSIVTLILLYSGLPFFGSVNDLTNAVAAILSAVFAWLLFPVLREQTPQTAGFFLLAAWLGSLLIAGNSVLVAFGGMGWKLGGMYTAIGLALQGVWLLGMVRALATLPVVPAGLVRLGFVAGLLMLAGLAAGPLLAYGERFYGNPLVWILFASAGGGWLLYPLWCWLLGRQLIS